MSSALQCPKASLEAAIPFTVTEVAPKVSLGSILTVIVPSPVAFAEATAAAEAFTVGT